MANIRMNAASIGGLIQLNYTGPVTVPSDGIITIDSRDGPQVLRMGGTYLTNATRQAIVGAAIAGAAGKIVASAGLSNSSYVIANQPDFPRLLSVRVDPGTSAITAGQAVVSYIANDGSNPQLDTISFATGAGTVFSTNLSKGAVFVNSLVVSGLVGGTSPGIQMDTLNFLAAIVDNGFVDFSVLNLTVDAARSGVASTIASSGVFLPSTIPNSTHTYNAVVTFFAPTP